MCHGLWCGGICAPLPRSGVLGPKGRKPEGRCRPRSCLAKQGLERYGDCNSPGSGAPNRATLLARIGMGRCLLGRADLARPGGWEGRLFRRIPNDRKNLPGGPFVCLVAGVRTASSARFPIVDCLFLNRLPPTVQVACRWGRRVKPWGFGGVGRSSVYRRNSGLAGDDVIRVPNGRARSPRGSRSELCEIRRVGS
jgi:hypothetical protein